MSPQLTEAQPLPELTRLAGLYELLVKVLIEFLDHRVHIRLHDQHRRGGVVAHHGALHLGVLGALHLAEHVVLDLAIDDGAAVLVEVGLDPAAVGAVDNLGDLRVVDVEEVGPDTDDGAVLLVELLDIWAIVGGPRMVEPPEVGPSWLIVRRCDICGV